MGWSRAGRYSIMPGLREKGLPFWEEWEKEINVLSIEMGKSWIVGICEEGGGGW